MDLRQRFHVISRFPIHAMQTLLPILPYVPLLTMLLWAAVADARTRLIRNWLTFLIILSGLFQAFSPLPSSSLSQSATGMLVGLGLLMLPFAIGAIGGGDVKLLAGIGAWLGPYLVFQVFVVEAVVGLAIILIQASVNGKLSALFRNSAVLALSLANADAVGLDEVQAAGKQTSIDRPLPYAVPTLIATVLVLGYAISGGK